MNITKNVLANCLGQGWRALMSLAFIPLYIRYLGLEAYGLIGIFAVLQTLLSLFDMGMRPALGREMARFTAGAHDPQSIRDLLRSVEVVGISVACLVALGLWVTAPWLASEWLTVEIMSPDVVAETFAIMAAVIGLRLVEGIYVSSLAGLQLQVTENLVTSVMATIRDVGVLAVLLWVSPTIHAFFLWHALVSLLTVAVLAAATYRALPAAHRAGRYSSSALLGISRFAAGMTAITFLALLLTQLDKILVARLLPLTEFTYYAVAGTVANALYMLAAPISAAYSPRLTELVIRKDATLLRDTYHQGAQLIAVFVGAAAFFLIAFGDRVVLLWTADPTLTQRVATLLRVLALGTLLNALIWIPYQMQLAHGWTALGAKINAAAVVLLVPIMFWIVPRHGAIGAAWVWVVLNTGYVVFTIYFMHRRVLTTEKWRWYAQDVAAPLLVAAVAALLCWQLLPLHAGRISELLLLISALAVVLAVAAFGAPLVRRRLTIHLLRVFRSSQVNLR